MTKLIFKDFNPQYNIKTICERMSDVETMDVLPPNTLFLDQPVLRSSIARGMFNALTLNPLFGLHGPKFEQQNEKVVIEVVHTVEKNEWARENRTPSRSPTKETFDEKKKREMKQIKKENEIERELVVRQIAKEKLANQKKD